DGQTKILDANKKVTETTENLKAASKVILSICIVVVIICIALAIIFPAMLSKPIRIISDMVMDIAKGEGDLTKRLSVMSKDEIGDMATGFNQFVGNLQNIIREISNVEQSLSGIIEDIKVSCGELNNGVLKQDEALGITSDLMSKMQTGFEEARNNIASLASAVQENSATMEQMIKSLQAAGENTQKLTGSVGTVSSSITQIATGIQTISTNAKKLGDTVNSTASAIEENIVTLQSITKNIQGANDNAKNMSVEAEKGDAAVSGTIKGFKEIEGALKTQIEIINGLENKSKEIDTIVKVISDIAGQTNLLALNAAIEAARAGEHGKGFSVVADEVRKLAEQTGEATKKIGTLIKGIQEETRKAVESSDITNIKMNEGANLVNTAGDALKGILSSVITVTTAMNEITCLMVEQDKTNQSLSSAVTEMQSLTEQVVTSTIQQGESSKLIIHESTKMNDLTNNVSASIIQLMDAGSNILSTVRKMSDRANEVNVMIDKQMESVSTVVNSSKTVKETSESVGTEGDKLNNIAENLVENADLLKKYVNQFKIGTVELAQEQEELNKKVKAKKLAENRLKNKKTAKIVEEQPEDGGSNENTDLIIDDNDSDEKVMKSVKPTTKYSAKKQVNEKQIQPETKKNISGKQQEKELTARERLRMKAGRMN
ncbi:methyl-accepting chemotaxis protein, partial [Candidatus Dependentiae bacterium]|nr:methyl-accepting chemotaxis protein [Candidatus Dependentiae bacterium]